MYVLQNQLVLNGLLQIIGNDLILTLLVFVVFHEFNETPRTPIRSRIQWNTTNTNEVIDLILSSFVELAHGVRGISVNSWCFIEFVVFHRVSDVALTQRADSIRSKRIYSADFCWFDLSCSWYFYEFVVYYGVRGFYWVCDVGLTQWVDILSQKRLYSADVCWID